MFDVSFVRVCSHTNTVVVVVAAATSDTAQRVAVRISICTYAVKYRE